MKDKTKTGWERENRTHFDDIVVNYDKSRWDYPAELFADIFEYVGMGQKEVLEFDSEQKEALEIDSRQIEAFIIDSKKKNALEIGAGTGKATTPFLDAGYDVTAVEMGANMSAFLLEKFKEFANFSVITTTFEDAVLQDNSYDLIYAASAFHWIDAKVGCPKVHRLLKNGGVFALFKNNVIQSDKNQTYNEIQEVYEKHYYSHYKSDKRPVKISKMQYEDFVKPEELYRSFRFEGLEQYGFVDVSMKLYETMRIYGADEYIALMDTMSDHRAMPENKRAALYAGIKDVIIKHGGQIEMNYIFQLYMGRKKD